MPTSYKILAQSAPSAAQETLIYTVPALTSSIIRGINITNTSASADTYTIAIVPVAASAATTVDYIAFSTTIAARTTVTLKGYTLAAGNGIRVVSTNARTTFSVFGAEVS
jgi:hypothetical protein